VKRRIGLQKVGALVLALVLALGSLGVGYATWTQNLTITETVETGLLCWGCEGGSLEATKDTSVPPEPEDPGQDEANWDWNSNVGFWGEPWKTDKNVGYVELELLNDKGCDHMGKNLYETANVTFHNVYPCYFNDIHVWVANGGNIPLKIEAIRLTYDSTTIDLVTGKHYWNDWMEIIWGDAVGEQMEPCSSREISFKFHILEEGDIPEPGADPVDGAQPDTDYEFTIELVGTQWNMAQ